MNIKLGIFCIVNIFVIKYNIFLLLHSYYFLVPFSNSSIFLPSYFNSNYQYNKARYYVNGDLTYPLVQKQIDLIENTIRAYREQSKEAIVSNPLAQWNKNTEYRTFCNNRKRLFKI